MRKDKRRFDQLRLDARIRAVLTLYVRIKDGFSSPGKLAANTGNQPFRECIDEMRELLASLCRDVREYGRATGMDR